MAGAVSYIVAFQLGGGEVYYSGFAEVGEEFTMLAAIRFAANMNVTVYDPKGFTDAADIVRPENMIQTLKYHSSCSQNLFLKDRFGSVQLVVFVNQLQGTVTCFQNVTLGFSVEAPIDIEGGEATLTGLRVISSINNGDGGIFNLDDKVAGVVVRPGDPPFQTSATITIDLTQRLRYTLISTVIGQTDEGIRCFGVDAFQFVAGNPLPPIFPTLAPSAAPTISPFPTPDPDTAACEIGSAISCRKSEGGSCRSLQSPAGSLCLGSNANQLRFIYTPQLCRGNNTQARFECTDSVQTFPTGDAFLRVARRDSIFFQGVVSPGQLITVGIQGNANDMDIAISSVLNNGPGTLLQASSMSLRCREEDSIRLLDTYGALQLVGFRNAEQGSQQIFESLVISYTVRNTGVLDLDLTSAVRDSNFVEFSDFLTAPDFRRIEPRGSEVFEDRFTLNLVESAGQNFDFTFVARGVGTVSREGCNAPSLFTLTVA